MISSQALRQKTCLIHFFALSSEAQKVLLTSCFKSFQPKVVSSGAFRHRKLSFQYFVKSGMPNHQVCKTALKALFQVTKGKLDCIAKRIMQGSQNVPSQQGRHMNRPNRISATTRQQVMDHIKLYPTESSHYSRSRNPHTGPVLEQKSWGAKSGLARLTSPPGSGTH